MNSFIKLVRTSGLAVAFAYALAGRSELPDRSEISKAAPRLANGDGNAQANIVKATKERDERTEEMLSKMRSAVEEIAELYGNPSFVQIFTNDKGKADELRERLKQTETLKKLKGDATELAAQNEKLENEIRLHEQETKRLSERLSKQRAALDLVAGAIDATNRAVESTTP